jgi:putative ABC transport system permease protein
MAFRVGLFSEVIVMAFDTVRTNKMRSALTVLGVVIGITSIVGMTAMIRGFDQSLRDMIGAIGPNTIFVQRFGVTSFASGAEFKELLKRPNITISDARAIEEMSDTIQLVDIQLGAGGPPTQRRVFYGTQKTKPIIVFGTTENFAEGTKIPMVVGRFFNGTEVQYRKSVVVLGNTPYQLLFQATGTDPIGKFVRIGKNGSKWSASSTSGRPPAASTSGRTTSRSFPTPPTSGCLA